MSTEKLGKRGQDGGMREEWLPFYSFTFLLFPTAHCFCVIFHQGRQLTGKASSLQIPEDAYFSTKSLVIRNKSNKFAVEYKRK